MRWIWDEEKNRIDRRDHKVPFELAALVFDDPSAVSVPDPHLGEARWRTVGSPNPQSGVMAFVVHTSPELNGAGEEVGRKATRRERRAYGERSC